MNGPASEIGFSCDGRSRCSWCTGCSWCRGLIMVRLLISLVAVPLFASVAPAQTTIVADVRAAIAKNDVAGADQLLAKFRQTNGTTPEALEALSWLGRGALAAGD